MTHKWVIFYVLRVYIIMVVFICWQFFWAEIHNYSGEANEKTESRPASNLEKTRVEGS